MLHDRSAGSRRWLWFALPALSLAVPAALVLLAYFVIAPPAGEPVAIFDLTPGERFDVTFASPGERVRVFFELDCSPCSQPVDGDLEILVDGRQVKHLEIAAGKHHPLTQHQVLRELALTSIPAAPAGTPVSLRGVFVVRVKRPPLSSPQKRTAPREAVRVLRLVIAP